MERSSIRNSSASQQPNYVATIEEQPSEVLAVQLNSGTTTPDPLASPLPQVHPTPFRMSQVNRITRKNLQFIFYFFGTVGY